MSYPTEEYLKALEAIGLQTAKEQMRKATVEADATYVVGQERVAAARAERQQAESLHDHAAANYREFRRPWRVIGAEVSRVDDRFRCGVQGVEAFGDTPEMATDNFDHLWQMGDGPA
ncbi:MAG: hypothetical protein ABFC88_12405 [Thermoguttaceae bacterium]